MFKCLNNRGFTPHLLWGKKDSAYLTSLKKGGGFTLVEMLVAVAIFVVVITIILGLLVHAVRGQRQNLAYQELLDQTSYAMEYMSRSIRMAMKDDVKIWGYPEPPPPNCIPDGAPYERGINYGFDGVCLMFRNYHNQCQQFCLEGTRLKEIKDSEESFLTSPDLTVSSFDIDLRGEGQADNLQPLVIIDLTIEGREETMIRIKTSVSQRNLDTEKTLP